MRIKQLITMALSGSLAMTLLSGCGNTATSADPNAVVTEMPERGLTFTISQNYLDEGVQLDGFNYNQNELPTASIYYYYRPITDKLMDDFIDLKKKDPTLITPEYQNQFYEQLWAHSRCLMNITLVPEADYQGYLDDGKSLDDLSGFNNTEEYQKNDGYVYLISMPDLDTDGMGDEEIAQYEKCKKYIPTVKEDLKFIPIKMESNDTDLGNQIPVFTASDLNGNTVTNDIFAKKDLTVVNVWGTFCTPCVEEMPELGKWAKEMPDNVQLVGLISDIEGDDDKEHHDLAEQIISKSDADFTQIIANGDFKDLLRGVVGVPTTFFVDREGNIIGDPIVGAEVDKYKAFVEEYLGK